MTAPSLPPLYCWTGRTTWTSSPNHPRYRVPLIHYVESQAQSLRGTLVTELACGRALSRPPAGTASCRADLPHHNYRICTQCRSAGRRDRR